MACKCKTLWFLLLMKWFFLLFLQSANENLHLSAVYLAGRKIANIGSEGDWWGRHYLFHFNIFNIPVLGTRSLQ